MSPMRTLDRGMPDTDSRDAVELSGAENASLCEGCVRCCTYVAVAIESPRASWEYDQWIWVLHHENIEMYVEQPEQWFVQFATRCRQLDPRGRCSIHGRHPMLCREYDPRTCERRSPLSDVRATFRTAEDLEAWLARERPGHWKRLIAWRKDVPAAPGGNGAGWIPLSSLAAPPSIAAPGPRRRRASLR